MRIAAVWLPPVQMDGWRDPARPSLIHLEADIHATEGNRNGFAKDEFVPYLVVHYTIVPVRTAAAKADRRRRSKENMMPMVARDGLHYGARIEMPEAGHYKLTYAIEPPSAGGWAGTSIARPASSPGGSRSRSRLTGIIPVRPRAAGLNRSRCIERSPPRPRIAG